PPPPDRETRGKTAPNRLRRVDHLLALWDPDLLRRRDGAFAAAPFVDLGFGESPVTTLELARRLQRVAPGLPVIGVENDRSRVRTAIRCTESTDPPTAAGLEPPPRFLVGGFDLGDAAPARGIRAFNVLRQYEEADVGPAYRAMGEAILPGGLIVEGTSDPSGRVWTAMIVRRGGEGAATGAGGAPDVELTVEALVFGTNFRASLDAETFQAVLPKRLIHRVVPGEPVHGFMADWARLRRIEAGSETWGPRYAFGRIATGLRAAGHSIETPERLARRGWVVWRSPPVDPHAAAG
ncbi:MAG: hypothetical protein ACYTEV_02980, partial [Planctomycetota bacterium]